MPTQPRHTAPESGVHYHDHDPNDPYVEDHQRHRMLDELIACWACDCAEHQDNTCRCSCHSERRSH